MVHDLAGVLGLLWTRRSALGGPRFFTECLLEREIATVVTYFSQRSWAARKEANPRLSSIEPSMSRAFAITRFPIAGAPPQIWRLCKTSGRVCFLKPLKDAWSTTSGSERISL